MAGETVATKGIFSALRIIGLPVNVAQKEINIIKSQKKFELQKHEKTLNVNKNFYKIRVDVEVI